MQNTVDYRLSKVGLVLKIAELIQSINSQASKQKTRFLAKKFNKKSQPVLGITPRLKFQKNLNCSRG
jgi:hypothetical protein